MLAEETHNKCSRNLSPLPNFRINFVNRNLFEHSAHTCLFRWLDLLKSLVYGTVEYFLSLAQVLQVDSLPEREPADTLFMLLCYLMYLFLDLLDRVWMGS
jgi:hypothetical protein